MLTLVLYTLYSCIIKKLKVARVVWEFHQAETERDKNLKY